MLNLESLREQVYQNLREDIAKGRLLPGSSINLKSVSQHLGISKTPLRDAIIQLECDGFVTILPRRGIIVNKLTLPDIRNLTEIAGALEAAVIISVFDELKPSHINEMERLNAEMISAIHNEAFDRIYELNIAFHDVFLSLSDNELLKKNIMPIKQRLYDFPRRAYIKEWELINCAEHTQLIAFMRNKDCEGAVSLWKDRHWSFSFHEKFIRKFYLNASEKIRKELAMRQISGL
ncbi:MAG: GntR family transcriptional regulator [Deltaproteobacteria bacterium]|nr:GntR family transcriptional regulator [Deltaproteobacteria bacterium]